MNRSQTFFNDSGVAGFTHRAFFKSMGYDDQDLNSPVIGICNTFSELNNCHRHFRELAEAVKRGVWQAGGFPLEFPTISDWSTNKDNWFHNCVFTLKGPDEALEFLVQCMHGKQQINDFSKIVKDSQPWEVKGLPCIIFNLWWQQTEDRTGNDFVYLFRLGPQKFAGRYTPAKRGSRR